MLFKALLLLSALVVSYSLPLRTFSALLLSHTLFQCWCQQQNSTTKNTPEKTSLQHGVSLAHRHIQLAQGGSASMVPARVAAVGQQPEPLPLSVCCSPTAHDSGSALPACTDSDNILENVKWSRRSPARTSWKVVSVNWNVSLSKQECVLQRRKRSQTLQRGSVTVSWWENMSVDSMVVVWG